MVGTWKAQPTPDVSVALTLKEDGAFTWDVDNKGQKQSLEGHAGFKDGTLALLHAEEGQTLGALAARLDMTRQAVSQHLAILEGANLIATVRRGREKLHYLNPVPIHEVHARWIAKFERPRLDALAALKQRLEGDQDG